MRLCRLQVLGGIEPLVAILALSMLSARPCLADSSPSASAATSSPSTSAATDVHLQELYRDGRKARERGDLASALRLLQQAWSIRQTHDSAASLSQVEYELGKVREAAEHLAYALDHLPADVEPDRAIRMREAFAHIQKEVVTLRLHVEPKTAEVFLNGKSLGLAQGLAKEIYADPGKIQLSASCDNCLPWNFVVEAKGGETQDVNAELNPSAPQVGNASAGAPVSELGAATPYHQAVPAETASTAPTRPWWPIAVSGGAAVVSVTVGFVFMANANSAKSDANRAQAQIGDPSGCGASGGAEAALCAQLRSARDEQRSANRVANPAWIAAGVFGSVAALATAWFLWPEPKQTARANLRLAPTIAPNFATLSLEGTFR